MFPRAGDIQLFTCRLKLIVFTWKDRDSLYLLRSVRLVSASDLEISNFIAILGII
jgi:hypothetical protein